MIKAKMDQFIHLLTRTKQFREGLSTRCKGKPLPSLYVLWSENELVMGKQNALNICPEFFSLGESIDTSENFQMFKLGLEKEGEPEVKLPTLAGS